MGLRLASVNGSPRPLTPPIRRTVSGYDMSWRGLSLHRKEHVRPGPADGGMRPRNATSRADPPHAEGCAEASPIPTPDHASSSDPSSQLQQTRRELADLQQLYGSLEQQINSLRQEKADLSAANSQLRHRLMRLARKICQIRHFAYHDRLTGLPNRSLLLDRLNQAIMRATRQQKQVALLFLDLDGFKTVNDRLGHSAGDEILQQVAQRLIFCLRGGDTACRYGGDEFVIMLPDVASGEIALAVADKVRLILATPYNVDNEIIPVTASVGAAVYPFDGNSVSELINRADSAMYKAKRHG